MGSTSTISIDVTAPVVVDLFPADGSFVNDLRPTLSATVIDTGGSGVDPNNIPVTVNGTPVNPTVTLLNPNKITVECTPSIDFTHGAVTFRGEPVDFSGTEATWLSTFIVDPTPPTISIDISPPGTDQPTKIVTATFDDALSGVDPATRTILIDGLDVTSGGVFSGDSWTLTDTFADGTHTVLAEAQDLAGNSAQESETFDVVLQVALGTIEGLVLDATSGLPIPGLIVRVVGTDKSTRSNAGGFYQLNDVDSGPQVLIFGEIDEDFNQSDSQFAYAANFRRPTQAPHVLANGTLIFNPTYLPRDDDPRFHTPFGPPEDVLFPVLIGGETFAQIITTQEVVLESPNFPGVTTTIPAGVTVNLPDPRMTSGAVMSVDTIPSPLPDGVFTAGVFGFGPEGTFFTDPGATLPSEPCTAFTEDPLCLRMNMTFPNLDQITPGTGVDIFAPNFLLGTFVVIGRGTVSDDGTIINSNGGVLRVLDWHFAAPPPPPPEFTELVGDVIDQDGNPVNATIVVIDTGQVFGTSGFFSTVRRIANQGECTTIRVTAIKFDQVYQGVATACDVVVGRTPGDLGLTDFGTFVLFFVDVIPPVVDILSPPDGDIFLPGDSISTTIRAVDNVGVESISYNLTPVSAIDGPASGIGIFSPPASVATFGPNPFTIDPNVVPPGIVSETACAVDEQGLVGCDFHDYLVLGGPPDPNDTTPPRVEILTPRNTLPRTRDTQGSTRTVTVRCTDDLSGCKQIAFTIRGAGREVFSVRRFFSNFASPPLDVTRSTTYNVSIFTPPGRTIRINASAIDDAGNRGTATPVRTVVVGSRDQQPAVVPNCGTDLGLGDNDSQEITLPPGTLFPFYEVDRSSFFVNSNGNITFGAPDPLTLNPTRNDFLGPEPRIAPFFRDLNPTVCLDLLPDPSAPERAIITWSYGPAFPASLNDVVQAQLFTNLSATPGRIDFIYPGTQSLGTIVGITPGGANPVFIPVNFSSLSSFVLPTDDAVLEEFSANSRFDLDGGFIKFTPTNSYRVEVSVARTTVIGQVLAPDGVTPAAGIDVSLRTLGDLTVTGPDGTFVLLNVPTVLPIVAEASGQIGGLPVRGQSESTAAVLDGITDVGQIVTGIVVSVPTIIGAADTQFDNQSLIIDGTTVTIDGSHSFVNLTLRDGAVVTQSGATTTTESRLDLQVQGTLEVDGTSRIDVTDRGYLGGRRGSNASDTGRTLGNAPGSTQRNGGSHGGLGGFGSVGGTIAAAYGDFLDPNDPGGGGGSRSDSPGGNGGGVVRISVGTFRLDGQVLANGRNGTGGCCAAGGGGGSIRLDVGTLSGAGTIRANGGTSTSTTNAGGGGGGRVAVYYTDASGFDLTGVEARGGTGRRTGGAGTVFLKAQAQQFGDLRIIGGGANTPLPANVTLNSVVLEDQARVVGSGMTTDELDMDNSTLTISDLQAGDVRLTASSTITTVGTSLVTESRLTIDAVSLEVDGTSRIDVTDRGYLGGRRGGNNVDTARTLGNVAGSTARNGGSHGGLGGFGSVGGSIAVSYGDFRDPNDPGGGGGSRSDSPGGNGGGVLRISVGTFQLDGPVLANGRNGVSGCCGGGGGGGSIRLDVGTLSGVGTIHANGGTSTSTANAGGGGGGRVAVYYTDASGFDLSQVEAYGGGGRRNGGAGSVFLESAVQAFGDLGIDGGGLALIPETALHSLGQGSSTGLSADTLTDVSASFVLGALKGLELNPDTSQSATFTIIDNDGTTIFTDPADGDMTTVAAVGDSYFGEMILDSLLITGQAVVTLLDGNQNRTDRRGTLTTTELRILTGSVLTHPTATTTRQFGLELDVGTLEVDGTSRLDVSSRGYLGGRRGGNGSDTGRTLGNASGSTARNGGSHGGLGGFGNLGGSVAAAYGDSLDPNDPGGGGGSRSDSPGGNGGGVLRISAQTFQVDGEVLADGGIGSGCCGGGGGGGSIRLDVGTLSGGGIIRANGGRSSSTTNAGGGGGGRVAVYYSDASGFNLTGVEADGGTGRNNGGAGTVFLSGP